LWTGFEREKDVLTVRRLGALYRSTVGKKFIVAVTGIVMVGFLIGHVAGNLKVFLPPVDGQPDIDVYAGYLRSLGEPLLPHMAFLWLARIVLLGSLVLHVVCVIQLSTTNLVARSVEYQSRRYSRATPPARWMMYTGSFLLLFIIVHLLHFTVGAFGAGFEHGRVYQNLYGSFSSALWVLFYAVSLGIVALHLYHGVWSLFQTLGFDNPDRNRGYRRLAAVLAVGLFVGFVAVPVSFFSGALKSPDEIGSTEVAIQKQIQPSEDAGVVLQSEVEQ
jgi:succinate dehydrogenase / fumarate reductase cytochrome b subunit